MLYLTSSAVKIRADNIMIQLNKALTSETITLSDSATSTTFSIITGAASAGQQFLYTGLRSKGEVTITPSAAVDAAVNNMNL